MNSERPLTKDAAYATLASNTLKLNSSVSELTVRLDQVNTVQKEDVFCCCPSSCAWYTFSPRAKIFTTPRESTDIAFVQTVYKVWRKTNLERFVTMEMQSATHWPWLYRTVPCTCCLRHHHDCITEYEYTGHQNIHAFSPFQNNAGKKKKPKHFCKSFSRTYRHITRACLGLVHVFFPP